VAERAAHGAFGSVPGLARVRGIGPKLAARLAPMVTFSGVARPTVSGRAP
jgi:DNA uptake protein ComE-like DNA-binding protein